MSNDQLAEKMREVLTLAEKGESCCKVEGTWKGLPLVIYVAVGASAGLMKKYAQTGGLTLTPQKLEGDS